ncbi:MAG: glycoside hydrolase family 2 protein [Chitinivibrionales bacterium]|nr:glycoside hydrolase family 2 protein [Chitinivibrionales bacterium]
MVKTIDLSGEWRLHEGNSSRSIAAQVPGCVHGDLFRAGKIPDPFYRDNESKVQWVGERDWVYRRTFTVPRSMLSCDRLLLRCEGLDTLATVTINGAEVATTDNMFRIWELDVASAVQAGSNEIEVRFASTIPFLSSQPQTLYAPQAGPHEPLGQGRIRKAQYQYGWDWAPRLITCGIWRPIRLTACKTARIADVAFEQQHRKTSVRLGVAVSVERFRRTAVDAVVTIRQGRTVVATRRKRMGENGGSISVAIRNPKLWWPNTLGAQPLYDVSVELRTRNNHKLDRVRRRIGLRTLHLERTPDRYGESFQFVVNGVPFFARGANWVPVHSFPATVDAGRSDALLRDCAQANFTMLRVWGGGVYEPDHFYETCDRLGICVWQDFMAACTHLPLSSSAFVNNFIAEAADQVRRLRHHPCIVLWCGNNELEMGGVAWHGERGRMSGRRYRELFDTELPRTVAELDPARPYWPGSPHSPHGDRREYNSPGCGDAHLWDVWGYDAPIDHYLTSAHRFVSEFGFQSFPHPRTIEAFTQKKDRELFSDIMSWHQRSDGGHARIMGHADQWFRRPSSFTGQVRLSQIVQAFALQTAVDHWRRSRPRTMGALYWQLNDCWPAISWSSIDHHGRWKALHYVARRFFAPLSISGVVSPTRDRVDVYMANDTLTPFEGVVRWYAVHVDGKELESGKLAVAVAANRSECVAALELGHVVASNGGQNVIVFLELLQKARMVSRTAVTFVRPNVLELQPPKITVNTKQADGGVRLRLSSEKPALWVWAEIAKVDTPLSDNYFHLRPGTAVDLAVRGGRVKGARVRVWSLVDLDG